ncbi:MAG: YihY/virulence factor BrkB family protein [Balneolaceae bacterium]|nr:YihY/virulence factor BrkB family protein [Balneolaceae bacterium]MCH8549708.1 YihY/virulence factor BrkB family protein [Balneolaceae bacterium]
MNFTSLRDKLRLFGSRLLQLTLKKHVFFNASAITFNLVICAIPFTLILISILGYILSIDAAFEEVIRYGRELLPNLSFETQDGDLIEGTVTIEELIMPLVGARQIFGIAGIVILLLFAQGLLHAMKHVIFEVFEFEDRKHPAMELAHNFFTFGVIGAVFLIFSMAVSIISIFTFEDLAIPYTDLVIELGWVPDFLTFIIPIVFTPLLLYAIFRYSSERRIEPIVALIAALSYTLLFELARFGVGFYIEYALTAYRYFYQGYAIVILLGIWVFYTAALFVFSSILARAYQDVFMEEGPAIEKNPYTAIS